VKSGIVILSALAGPARDRVLEIQRQFDPRLAAGLPPHVTITGSSGAGPLSARTSVEELRAALEPIAQDTAPMTLRFMRPKRFMQSNVVVLPFDPHGPIRILHDRIRGSGLRFERERFTFTPHVTLNLFRQLSDEEFKQLLRVRVDEPVTIDSIAAHRTVGTVNTERMLVLPLRGVPTGTRNARSAGDLA
jgi:2'-5' RNA ligase